VDTPVKEFILERREGGKDDGLTVVMDVEALPE
jgi:hypothetical protein